MALKGVHVSHVFSSCLIASLSPSGINNIFISLLILGVMSMNVLFLKIIAWNSASRKLCFLSSQIVQPNIVFLPDCLLSASQLLKQKEGLYVSDLSVNFKKWGRLVSPMFFINSLIDKLNFFGVTSFNLCIPNGGADK